ncbi:MAG TPA: DNA replication and repair protein RecF [Candidatus Polarisedimenticolaceae bacterium]|nr:DNA replication and repair protein RecF [Candidatus Polarisedimenticolaceae bacterium]
MWLKRLHAEKIRNLKAVAVDLPAGLALIAGRNGQGKTSLLEAAYLLGTTRSFRTGRTDEIVAREGGPGRIAGEVAGLSGSSKLTVVLDSGIRRLFVDDVERPIDAYLGRLDLVALPSDSARVLRDGPDGRRRFIDSGIAGLRPGFLADLGDYRRALAERNALLRRGGGAAHLDAWDEQLTEAASRLHRQRRAYVLELGCRLGEAERALLAPEEEIVLRYRPSPSASAERDPAEFAGTFREALARSRGRDLALGFTSEGPHKDDLETVFAGADIRRFGSAGQLRATMIALCAGKLSLLKERHQESPLFLMDDFDSDLDEIRVRSLIDFLSAGGFQALLASSKVGSLERPGFSFPTIRMEGGLARAA